MPIGVIFLWEYSSNVVSYQDLNALLDTLGATSKVYPNQRILESLVDTLTLRFKTVYKQPVTFFVRRLPRQTSFALYMENLTREENTHTEVLNVLVSPDEIGDIEARIWGEDRLVLEGIPRSKILEEFNDIQEKTSSASVSIVSPILTKRIRDFGVISLSSRGGVYFSPIVDKVMEIKSLIEERKIGIVSVFNVIGNDFEVTTILRYLEQVVRSEMEDINKRLSAPRPRQTIVDDIKSTTALVSQYREALKNMDRSLLSTLDNLEKELDELEGRARIVLF